MEKLVELGSELEERLRLKTKIIAVRQLDGPDELRKINNVTRMDRFFTFCQVPFLVRVNGFTVGISKNDNMNDRCTRLCGLQAPTEESKEREASRFCTSWMGTKEEALRQQEDYPRIAPKDAMVLAPLIKNKFRPEVLLIYGTPAQLMMLMCGMQKEKYEKFTFTFIGEGACSDSLARCYVTGKPSLSIPCYGERAMGSVGDDEISIALPAAELERAVKGLRNLHRAGLRFPIGHIGPNLDPSPVLAKSNPSMKVSTR